MVKYVLSVLFCCLFLQGISQNYFDIAKLSYTNTPPNDFDVSNEKTTVEELALELNFPILINEKTILLTGLFANKTSVKLNANMPSTNLNVVGINFGVNKTFNDKWSATVMAFTKIASDKIKLSSGNFQLGLLSLFTNTKQSDLKYRYGVYANTEMYGLIIVPIFGLYYVSNNKKFEANLNLPIIGDINYRMSNNIWLGMRFDGLGTTYNLSDQSYSENGAYVSKTSNELVSYLRLKLSKSLYLNTNIGYAISRSYKVFDSEDKVDFALSGLYFGDDRTQLNENFKDGVLFKVELMYRLHFD
ncbi:DUF6268 family outer membrane beta-barrel protein [Yeosuana sp. MJ-SS3]|jgi:hypothetical protein|uniref:DUF6268 family outer membrane beta-barrel protein n=1 Tax=Gilvirhabdus luticola TaxID=3079858 RepID=A0ABU3U9F9_9FLAO|nr:DUF6268 family outer membrane beta-barrel protein [Yeosuana sp. MJ-SS3]MDU8887048.1 DUF6268 family outer membrane beta-barrel protein [Yeosuana sp. MJ-SS3]